MSFAMWTKSTKKEECRVNAIGPEFGDAPPVIAIHFSDSDMTQLSNYVPQAPLFTLFEEDGKSPILILQSHIAGDHLPPLKMGSSQVDWR
jgi:hypothetical protein